MLNLKNKNVLVTGGTGLIGQPLVKMLLEKEANVRIVSLDNPSLSPPQCEFMQLDLTSIENCMMACKDMDVVFNLIGVKTSPHIIQKQPANVFVPFLMFNTNMLEASRVNKVEWFLYTSTVGVYPQLEIMKEDDVWTGFPSKNDWYGGWAKRMGELQIETYRKQYGLSNYSTVRPANCWGQFDNFTESGMIVPSLIKRLVNKDEIVINGDGSAIRDFIYSKECARGMIYIVENQISEPLNLGSGVGITIKSLVDKLLDCVDYVPNIRWDLNKPSGDRIRILDMTKAKSYGFIPQEPLNKNDILETMNWYKENKNKIEEKRFNIFKEN